MSDKILRSSRIERQTSETQIVAELVVDGTGSYEIETGVPFLDHMLELFSRHGYFDLKLEASGDTEIDAHHTVEDIGIVLGQAFKKALGDKAGISRYGFFMLPMDEVLAEVAIDLSGRPAFRYDVVLPYEQVGNFDTALAPEFFKAFVNELGLALHMRCTDGEEVHHILEALFKAFARALDMATRHDDRVIGVPSTKGTLG